MSKKINHQFNCSKMLLPEHSAALKAHFAKPRQEENSRRPLKDEQLLAEENNLVQEALASSKKLLFTISSNTGHKSFSGVPLRFEEPGALIVVATENKQGKRRLLKIAAENVISIKQPASSLF